MNADSIDPMSVRTGHIDQYTGKILTDVRFEDVSLAGKAMPVGIALHMGTLGRHRKYDRMPVGPDIVRQFHCFVVEPPSDKRGPVSRTTDAKGATIVTRSGPRWLSCYSGFPDGGTGFAASACEGSANHQPYPDVETRSVLPPKLLPLR